MESQPQNPEFRNNPENFHPCLLLSNKDWLAKLFAEVSQKNVVEIL